MKNDLQFMRYLSKCQYVKVFLEVAILSFDVSLPHVIRYCIIHKFDECRLVFLASTVKV